MFCKICKAGALICKKNSSTCSTCGIRWTTSWAKAKKLSYDIPWGTILICHWHVFNVLAELGKWFSTIGGIKGQKGNIPFYRLRLVKVDWYGHCLLDNFKMINHQSSGLISSQKKKEFLTEKAMMDIYGKRFSVQKLAQCSQCVWISFSYWLTPYPNVWAMSSEMIKFSACSKWFTRQIAFLHLQFTISQPGLQIYGHKSYPLGLFVHCKARDPNLSSCKKKCGWFNVPRLPLDV